MWKINESRKNPDLLVLIGPFDFEFKEDLKRRIPAEWREWHDILKAWIIHRSYRSTIEYLIDRYAGSVEAEPKAKPKISDVTTIASRIGDCVSYETKDTIISGLNLGVEAALASSTVQLEGCLVRKDENRLLIVAGYAIND